MVYLLTGQDHIYYTQNHHYSSRMTTTLPEANSKTPPEDRLKPKKETSLIFQASIFRCELLVSGRVIKVPLAKQ